jgi:ABC-type transport system involved in multi-copper enzyme maturation permease subunit
MSPAMSDTAGGARPVASRPAPEGLFKRQLAGILRLELRRSLLGRRALGLYFLAFAPVLLIALWAATPLPQKLYEGPAQTANQIAILFQFYLRFSIYLSALLMFMSLFRNELLERSLHYYFLTPVRREVLVAGKYLAALFSAWIAFFIGTVALYLLSCVPWGLGELGRYLFRGPGLANLTAYVVTALLAVAGYGAVFMLVGQYFKNPVIPGLVIWGWELINPLLPATLKKVSVVFYLQSFYPVPPPESASGWLFELFRVLAEPPAAWASVLGLIVFTGLVILASGWRARNMEVVYGDD